jgi:DNA-binding transcriptional LysR family regulator
MATKSKSANLLSTKGISMERLQSLCRVVEADGISKACAAYDMDMGQVSRQLKELDAYFDHPLLAAKGKREFQLSEFGQRVYQVASAFFNEIARLRQEAQSMPERCIIAAGVGLVPWLIIPRCEALFNMKKDIHFEFTKKRSQEIVDGVLCNQIDFGLVRQSAITDDRIGFCKLGEMEFALFVSKATGRKYDLGTAATAEEILRKVPLVLINGDGEFRKRIESHSKSKTWGLEPVMEYESFVDAANAIANGAFCSVLPKIAISQLPPDQFYSQPWKSVELKRTICLIWNATRPSNRLPEGLKFIQELKKILAFHSAHRPTKTT